MFLAWQSARKRTEQGAFDASEELMFITRVLGNRFEIKRDLARYRAMLESALEVVPLPRQRSVLASDLCMAACRENDLRGAASWLSLADPASVDLYTDSMYRMANARLLTKQVNYVEVLKVLGQTHVEFPLHDKARRCVPRSRSWCTVLRNRNFTTALSPTGLVVNGVAQVEATVRVSLPNKVPYEAKVNRSLAPGSTIGPGAHVPILVDSNDPSHVAIEAALGQRAWANCAPPRGAWCTQDPPYQTV